MLSTLFSEVVNQLNFSPSSCMEEGLHCEIIIINQKCLTTNDIHGFIGMWCYKGHIEGHGGQVGKT